MLVLRSLSTPRKARLAGVFFVAAFVARLLAAEEASRPAAAGGPPAAWWSAAVEKVLARAGKNRGELERALGAAAETRRAALAFLVENMPPPDLESLGADFLLENVELAYEARERAPWGASLPEEVFLNDVLPYAVLNERRDAWRRELAPRVRPLVEGAKRPGEAAHLLNQKVFGLLGARYSTARRRADQSPLETAASGLASCTGLSILLVDACRAAAVPARIAGTPNWTNKRGNHTWVEVWDDGWHFAGAAEPDARGLDHAWFEHDASLAAAASREHAIYASSFRRTGLAFPLVWATGVDWVSAVNVTARYARAPDAPAAGARLLVRVVDRASGKRVAVPVEIADRVEPARILRGESRGESADTNDILAFELAPERAYEVRVGRGAELQSRVVRTAAGCEETLHVALGAEGSPAAAGATGLDPEAARSLRAAVDRYLAAAPEERSAIAIALPDRLDGLLAASPAAVRALVWEAYRAAPIHGALREDRGANRVRHGGQESPYVSRPVGEKPPGGWPLFIALHGGGGVRKEVNDQQWGVMQRYYRDQPEVGGYIYAALRAPNDRWNGFYDDQISPLVEALIRQFVVCDDVNPDRVFLLGYSHGGYGAFTIGTKIPHRFAAVHSSAAAPTDGETAARNLRSTVFTFMIGENDNAYGRLERCRAFERTVNELRGKRDDIYPVRMELQPGFGHGGLPDRDKVRGMYAAGRNPAPREVSWEMTDGAVRDFFWLAVERPADGCAIEATCHENRIAVSTRRVAAFGILLDERLIDPKRTVELEVDGVTKRIKLRPSLRTLLETLLARGDIGLAFTAAIDVPAARDRAF